MCMEKSEILTLINKVLGPNSDIVSPLVGGMMNISYIVKDGNGKKYVLYISTEQANEMVDRPLEKEHQQIINSLGITSKNVYFDVKKGIKINEFIEGNSLDKVEKFNYQKVATLLKTLHSSQVLSKEDYAPFSRFENIYENEALTFEKDPSPLYKELRAFLFSHKDYLLRQRKVICHNDAQRSNIIQTPEDEYYLIDFEFVGNNDPIYDIACFGNGLVSEGRTLLDSYCNGAPNEEQIKRYYLWRVFVSLQWYNVAITKHYRGEGEKHGFNFLAVAEHFLNNAKTAYDGYHMEINEDQEQKDTIKLIVSTLDKIRHFLRKDGGDCEFESFKDGIVYVRMFGACQGCSYAYTDIKELVEVILQEEVPGVVEVRLAE